MPSPRVSKSSQIPLRGSGEDGNDYLALQGDLLVMA
jgi:hypothetical protein